MLLCCREAEKWNILLNSVQYKITGSCTWWPHTSTDVTSGWHLIVLIIWIDNPVPSNRLIIFNWSSQPQCKLFLISYLNNKTKQRFHGSHLEFQDGGSRYNLELSPLHLLTSQMYVQTSKWCFYELGYP